MGAATVALVVALVPSGLRALAPTAAARHPRAGNGTRAGRRLPLHLQREHRRLHRCRRHRVGHRMARGPQQRHHLPRRHLRGPGRARRPVPGLRLRHLRRPADHLGRRRRLPPGPGDDLRRPGRHRLHHRVRRPGGPRRQPLRRRLQPGARRQPDRPHHHGRPRRLDRPGPPRRPARRGAGPPRGGPRLRRGRRPLRGHRAMAQRAGARDRRRLRPALRAHARLLGRPTDRHRAGPCARPLPGRRLQERLHHHPAHAERQRPRHRRQRLRDGVQPRRDRDPHQPLHPGLLHGGPRAAHRGPQRRRDRGSTSTACGPMRCPGPST